SHSQKSPTTLTRRAEGAQTANAVPLTPSTTRGCAPSISQRRRCVPSLKRWRSTSPITVLCWARVFGPACEALIARGCVLGLNLSLRTWGHRQSPVSAIPQEHDREWQKLDAVTRHHRELLPSRVHELGPHA